MWGEQMNSLRDFHCIAPDLPGHGDSRTIRWHSLEATADLIAEVIRKDVPGGKAHIVGLSLGSYVGLTLLSGHQNLVATAMLSGLNVLPLDNPALILPITDQSFRQRTRSARPPA
jgi:pimeloyl-ACP methyl ester carboxylesterase